MSLVTSWCCCIEIFCILIQFQIVLILSWACLAILGIIFLNFDCRMMPKTILRKFFHILVILVFMPGMIFDPKLLYFASCVAFFLFVLVEVIYFFLSLFYALFPPPIFPRNMNISSQCVRTSADSISAEIIQKSFEKFLDEKDQGALVLTHIYLLVGCSLPVWLLPYFNYASK